MQTARRAFTIVELLVALAVGSIVLTLVYQIFIAQRRGYTVAEDVAEMQQNSRIAADELARLIKNVGNGVDRNANQPQVLYCGPFELLFNSDLNGTLADHVAPGTDIPSLLGAGTLHTTAATAYAATTGAETHQVALVPDGARHFQLVRRELAGGTAGATQTIALNLRDRDAASAAVPLFLYWGEFDNDADEDLWGDTDGDGLLAAAELTALAPLTGGAGGTLAARFAALVPPRALVPLDQVVQRVEVSVVAETRSADRLYALNDGFRQAIVRSNATPRNLWDCPIISDTPDVATTLAAVFNGSTTHSFTVTQASGPYTGPPVQFTLVGPGAGTEVTVTPEETPDPATGIVIATVTWSDDCTFWAAQMVGGASPVYTLTATVPGGAKAFGRCGPATDDVAITVAPGSPDRVIAVSGPTPATLTTCTGTSALVFQVQNGCGTPVPLGPGDQIDLTTRDNPVSPRPFGTVTPSTPVTSVATVGAWPHALAATYTVPATGAWPTPSPAVVGGGYPAQVVATLSGASSWEEAPAVSLVPVPFALRNLAGALSLLPFSNCFEIPRHDTVEIVDCHGNLVPGFDLASYTVEPTLTKDVGAPAPAPANQGKLKYTGPLGGGAYGLTFEPPPVCTLGASDRTPTYTLDLKTPAATLSTLPVPPGSISLTACAGNCAIAISDITECTKQASVTVAGCGLITPSGATLTVASGDAWFDAAFTKKSISYTTFVSPTTLPLYVKSAPRGSSIRISAAFPHWTCEEVKTVSTACQRLQVFANATLTVPVDTGGGKSCLSNISELHFKVQDCQHSPVSVLRDAVTVYLLSEGGTYLDKVKVDLVPLTAGDLTVWRSAGAVPLIQGTATVPNTTDRLLHYAPGTKMRLVATYTDTSGNDPGDTTDPGWTAHPGTVLPEADCRRIVPLTTPIPICFPNAITSGGGGGWNGNFDIHWGDVVIRGDVELAAKPHFLNKSATAQFNGNRFSGSGNTDRFFDIYLGKNKDGSGGNFRESKTRIIDNPAPDTIDRPFMKDGHGHKQLKLASSESYGNYFRNISYDKITQMMRELDYDVMKALAKERGAYWYTLSSGQIRNPATKQQALPETVLNLPAVGTPNAFYKGDFIFIDTLGTADPGPTTTGPMIDAATSLPRHSLGGIYTEGIIYIAGSVDFKGGGGGQPITMISPPEYEMHYDHNSTTWTPNNDNLPIRSNPEQPQRSFVSGTGINVNGALYLDGSAQFSGSPTIYGAISAERGFSGGGTPEIWYNYNLNVTPADRSLCVNCCRVSLTPTLLTPLACGGTQSVTAVDADGRVILWASEDTGIASVVSSGLLVGTVTGRALGTTKIKGVDANNCPAWAAVTATSLTVTLAKASEKVGIDVVATTNAPLGLGLTIAAPAGVMVTPIAGSNPQRFTVRGTAVGSYTIPFAVTHSTCVNKTDALFQAVAP